MKKTIKRCLSLLLVAVMLFSFTACGDKKTTGDTETKSEGVLYSFEDIAMPEDFGGSNAIAYSNNTIFLSYWTSSEPGVEGAEATDEAADEPTDEATGEGSDVVYGQKIAKMEIGSGNWVEIPFAYEDVNKDYYISKMIPDSDGSLWLFVNSYSMPTDEEGDSSDDESGDYAYDSAEYELVNISDSGELKKTVNITSSLSDGLSNAYIYQVAKDDKGNLYVNGGSDSGETFLYVLDSEGNKLFQVDELDYVESFVKLSSGKVACTYYYNSEDGSNSGYKMQEIDIDTKALGEEYNMQSGYATISNCVGDNLYFHDSDNLYAYNLTSGEKTVLLNWLDNNVDVYTLNSLNPISDEQFIYSTYSYSENSSNEGLVLATRTDETIGDAEIITLGGLWIDDSIKSQIIAFNKKNEGVRINVKDYGSGTDDMEAAMQQFNADILSGNMPDIVDLGSYAISPELLVQKGLLEDFYTYIDKDEEISKDDFVPNVLKATEIDGGLYNISSGFYILTMVGKSEIVGEEMGWTFKDMMDIVNANPQADYPLGPYYSRSDTLQNFIMFGASDLVNWSTGECNFESDNFKALLEFVNTLPAVIDEDEMQNISQVEILRNNRQLFEITSISGYQMLQFERGLFGAEITCKGLPVSEGVGNAISFMNSLGISSQSEHKDEAWQFIRSLLLDEYQQKLVDEQLQYSSIQKWLDKGFEKALETDMTGSTWGMEDFTMEMTTPTQEDIAQYKELINSVNRVISYDASMNDIILEEAESYFAGDKTVDEAASLIQNRVETYINEQR